VAPETQRLARAVQRLEQCRHHTQVLGEALSLARDEILQARKDEAAARRDRDAIRRRLKERSATDAGCSGHGNGRLPSRYGKHGSHGWSSLGFRIFEAMRRDRGAWGSLPQNQIPIGWLGPIVPIRVRQPPGSGDPRITRRVRKPCSGSRQCWHACRPPRHRPDLARPGCRCHQRNR